MKNRKINLLTIASVLSLVALSGCNSRENNSSSSIQPTTSSSSATTSSSSGSSTSSSSSSSSQPQPTVSKVELNKNELNLSIGDTFTLVATVKGTNDPSQEVYFSSSKPEFATVSDSGVIEAKSNGTTIIVVTSAQDPSKSATCTVKVEDYFNAFDKITKKISDSHNYVMSISSNYSESEETLYEAELTNINDKAIYLTSESISEGFIYQKNQGYVKFTMSGSSLNPEYFVSTNTEVGVSELYDLCVESLLNGTYTQDSKDKSLFVTEDEYPLLVAYNLCGYDSSVAWSSSDTKLYCYVDASKEELKFKYTYWVYYIDDISGDKVTAEGTAYYTVSSIEKATNATIESYVVNPTKTYETPTNWTTSQENIWKTYYGNYVPPFLTNASYTFDFSYQEKHDGVHLFVSDLASGDQTTNYGNALKSAGFTAKSSTYYEKEVIDDVKQTKTTYSVTLKYTAASKYYPAGVFEAEYNEQMVPNNVHDVTTFNAYITAQGLTDVVPLMPFGDEVTDIDFKDATENMRELYGDIYRFWSKSPTKEFMKISIENYSTAKADCEAYISLVRAMGYTEEDVLYGVRTLSKPAKEGSSYSSSIWVTDPSAITSETYSGYIQMSHRLYKIDDPEPSGVLTGITVSGMTTQYYKDASFSFDGVCLASFSEGPDRTVTPTSVSTPDMSQVGKQTITVSYTYEDVTKTTTYEINIIEQPTHALEYQIDAHILDCHFEDSNRKVITSYNYLKTDYIAIVLEFEEGYTFNQLFLNGGQEFVGYFDDESSSLIIIPNDNNLPQYNFVITSKEIGPDPEPTKYNVTKVSGLANGTVMVAPGYESLEAGETGYVSVKPDEGYKVKSIDAVGYEGQITFTPASDILHPNRYSFVMPAHDIQITATFEEEAPVPETKYYITKVSGLTGGVVMIPSGYESLKAGDTGYVTVKPDEDYEVVSINAVGYEGQIVFTFDPDELHPNRYSFVMPAHDIQITATFKQKSPQPSGDLEKLLSDLGEITLDITDGYAAGEYCNFTFSNSGTAYEYAYGSMFKITGYDFDYALSLKSGTTYTIGCSHITSHKLGNINYTAAGVDKISTTEGAYFEVTFSSDLTSVESVHLHITEYYDFLWTK